MLQSQWDGHALRVAFDGIDDRDAAETLREWEILIERAALPQAAPREFYREDLLGFTVRNAEGVLLGSLQHFLSTPASPVMVVKGGGANTPCRPCRLICDGSTCNGV